MKNKQFFKKAIGLFLALALCVSLFPAVVYAEDATFTITFNANGGTGSIKAMTVTAGVEFTLPASNGLGAPSGQRFKAWDIGGTEYIPGATYTFSADTELKAVWQNQTGIVKPLTSGNAIKTIERGGLVFTDRGYHYFSGNYPEWMEGQEFLYGAMMQAVDAEVTGEGYIYIFTYPSGDNTILDDAKNMGFTQVTNYPNNTISTSFQPNYVAVKHVMPGEKLHYYKWGFMLITKTPVELPVTAMQTIASVAVGDNEAGGTIAKGGKIFADSDETFSSDLPSILADKNYIVGSKENGIEIAAATENNLYFLTPATGEGSQAQALENQGCTFLTTLAGNTISNALSSDIPVALYTKYVKPGDTVSTDGWCVVLGKKVSTYKLTYDANGGSGTMDSGICIEGSSFTLPECTFTAPEGFEFDAWDVNGSIYAAGQAITPTGDMTIKAVWKEIYVEKVITPNENQSLESIVIGREIFIEEGTVFADTVPDWLVGQNYIRASNAADIETTATADGWVYVLTYADGVEGSKQTALEADGFLKVSTIASGLVSAELNAGEMAVMAKQVKNGDAVSVGAGSIIVTSFVMFEAPVTLGTFAEVTPSNDEGADRAIAKYKLFNDSDFVFGTTVPGWISAKDFIKGSETEGISATVRTAGNVYFITPLKGEKSQVSALRNAGFEVTGLFNGETVFANDNTDYCVMGKSVEVGETVSCDGFGILLAHKFFEMGEFATIIPTYGIPKKVAVNGKVYENSTVTFKASTPAEFIGKDYIYKNNILSNAGGKVTRSGKIYISTPHTHPSSAESLLRELGFKYIKQLPESALGIGMASSLYEKNFKAGDVLNCSKYTLIFAKSEEVEFLGAQRREDSSYSAAFGIKAELLLSDASQISMVMGNKTYTTDLFGDASLIDWGEGYVYTKNEQGEDKLMFAIQIDNIGAEYMTEVDGVMVPNFKLYLK